MDFMIWSCFVAGALLAVALATALAPRLPRPVGTALMLLILLGVLATCVLSVLFGLISDAASAPIAASAGILVGSAAIVVLGRRSAAPGLRERALLWPTPRLAVVLALLTGIFITTARNSGLSAQQALATRRAELASLEQLLWPGVPDALNAAPFYARAYEKLVPVDSVPGARAAFAAVWHVQGARPDAPALTEWVRRNEDPLALAVEGSQRPGYATLEDALSHGVPSNGGRESKILRLEAARAGHDEYEPSDQSGLRRLADLLATRALQRAYSGQPALAVQDANALFALAEQTSSPWLRPERLAMKLVAAPGVTAASLAALRIPRGDGATTRLQRLLVRGEHTTLAFEDRFYPSRDPLDRAFGRAHRILWAQDRLTGVVRVFDGLWEAAYAPPSERVVRLRRVHLPGSSRRFFGRGSRPHSRTRYAPRPRGSARSSV
jgi:hypothetical protein